MTGGPTAADDAVTDVEAAAESHRAGRQRRLPWLPLLVSRLLFVAGVLLVAQTLLPGVWWMGSLVDTYSTLVVPIDGGSIGLAVFLLILAAAVARRKQVGWVITLVLFGFALLGDLLAVIGLVIAVSQARLDVTALPVLARFGFNLAALGSLTAVMVAYRAEFSARRQPGGIRRALTALLVGSALTFGIGLLLTSVFPNELSGPRGRAAWIASKFAQLVFDTGSDLLTAPLVGPPTWISTVVGGLFGVTLLVSLLILVRSQRRALLVSAEDEPRVLALVAESPEDSLAYFATRRDKSVVFAADGRSAVTYTVALGVCLASSDPIGPRDRWPAAIAAWLRLQHTYGWTPAVLGASEAGALAYARAGLRVIRIGDEAILHARTFRLESRELRTVGQAVRRLERLGYRTRVRRHGQIPAEEMARLIGRIAAWRDTQTERGFSMALGRLGDPMDADCLMVEALFPAGRAPSDEPGGEVAGLLSFVPWGRDGASLDVMRRHPGADNGVTELMVAALMQAGPELGVTRASLNFAVFRSAFEEGARIGAGPVLRLWRRLLLVASRWWQIESLFRSNVKYRPEWLPRFLCFAEARDLALVGLATGVAEGFIDLPRFLRPSTIEERQDDALRRPLPLAGADGAAVRPVQPSWPAETGAQAGAGQPAEVVRRMAVRADLLARGVDPYPPGFRPTLTAAGLRLGQTGTLAGRVLAIRDLGGVLFVRLRDWTGDAQLLLSADGIGRSAMTELRHTVDLGDHLGGTGTAVLSRSGELSLGLTSWTLTAKALRPPPDKYRGLADPEARVRQRYLDLAVNPAAGRQLRARSAAVAAVRGCLAGRGFLEVETPILQTVHGGANARPFVTQINAYDLDLYLRIAPELYLKRLMVGGVDRVFEIGRNFRNEGADATHNPEFTMLEAYQAYADYVGMRELARELVLAAACAVTGGTALRGRDRSGVEHEVELSEPWPVVPVHDAIAAATGVPVGPDTDRPALARLAAERGIAVDDRWSRGAVLLELYEHLVEAVTVRPTFYTDFPADVSPLTRPHRTDPRLAERWDLVAFGMEVGTAYSELVDPVEQRARLAAQSLQAAGGDHEAMQLDEDFLTALEYAMPPSGGLGMGMDRLVMLLTGTSIRESIAFPLVRPRPRR